MVSIIDVARYAGVSPSTVSYALSGKRPISAETRQRVQQAVRALGYRPHGGARAPADHRSKVLALMVPLRPGVPVPPAMSCAGSVVTTARRYDHDVLLLTRDQGEAGLLRFAKNALVDALIVLDGQLSGPRLPRLRALDLPTVLVGVPAEPAGLPCVDLDFAAAGELCVERLAALGHRVVALVGPPPEVYVRRAAFARRVVRGFTAAADRHGLASLARPCAASPEAARAVAERLLREQPALTAVVVHNEAVLGPLIDAFEQLGLRVPADLSVIAVCPADTAPAPRIPVTSVDLPSAELGERAVELLIAEPTAAAVPGETLLPPRLTDRASTAPRPV
ncbi:LacI family DNA-binding transcriptional regulator [Streptomyces sp. NPDC127190]|uniref:LacI family DNA-binding transcriptional regulator n=1 Tax=unclassified Streptomyces TaxID=2593676 RepID=UPI0036396256